MVQIQSSSLRKWLDGKLIQPSQFNPEALVPGETHLFVNHPIFRQTRNALIHHGVRFVSCGSDYEKYISQPLVMIDSMTSSRTIFFKEDWSDESIQSALQCPGLGQVGSFHEGLHLLIRYSPYYSAKEEDLVYLLLLEESMVNAGEWMATLEMQELRSKAAWCLQSTMSASDAQLSDYCKLRDEFGREFIYGVFLNAFCAANFLQDEVLIASLGSSLPSSLVGLASSALSLNPKFRLETNAAYLSNRMQRTVDLAEIRALWKKHPHLRKNFSDLIHKFLLDSGILNGV